MKLRALTVAAGAAVLALGLAACSGAAGAATGTDAPAAANGGYAVDANTLVFGVVPDSVDTQTNYQPLMDYLAKETGKKVEYHESTDYAALIEAAVAGKVDVASFSGFTYITATNAGAKLTPISSIVTKQGQEPGYYSEAIVPKGSSITSIKDFKGKKVCFVDPSSTSGYLFPSYNLLKDDIDPKTGVSPVFAGKHDVSVQKVGEGKECEAGFAEDSEVAKSDKVTVVDKTMVPGAPLVYNTALPKETADKVVTALKEITIDDIVKAGVKNADSDAFKATFYATKPVDDKYYDIIRDICDKTKADQCKK
ncbi:phosphate/phosphite/phosphonate ABC transporter substrate-binding protein [Microbacterium azadirachtae]|uniref:Phosphate-import protein PhnD n=1 Tax=Microbacterium azadirachtae TaxID=582680 RepID=A0A0F0LGY1_9MICO|nr:phosphate/phosphite/phosphonate ABC transporter substrate-binding protein [Microbacterium azadirachtae]KJL32393.1 Phosphate-import protein PhnD precursor [Microbacterium azadirachtae]